MLVAPRQDQDAEAAFSEDPVKAATFFDEMEIYPGRIYELWLVHMLTPAGSKITHFKRLHKNTGMPYKDMASGHVSITTKQ